MAQKYYNVAETAVILGIGEDEVKQMQARRELHGYRDGIDWKFKVDDIDQMAQDRAERPRADSDQGDVLLSEVELGASDPGASGTVIGMDNTGAKSAADSDLQLANSNPQLNDSGINLADEPESSGSGRQKQQSAAEELDLTLEEDLSLDESGLGSDDVSSGQSDLDLAGDDDQVLGGSSVGSDISIGGDSGISLVDPADSGLSLDEPLELIAGGDESLELGEDDMLAVAEDPQPDAPTELNADDDFLLTVDDAGEEEDSESGSQVIALEPESPSDEAATMVAGGLAGPSMAAMLDEDLSAGPGADLGFVGSADAGGSPLGGQQASFAEGARLAQPVASLPETPYSVWNILSLAFCALFLAVTGMMLVDLMRNMWSWDAAYSVNSSIMDTILGWFES